MELDSAVICIQEAVAAAPLHNFAVPHLVVDDVFPASLIAQINDNWPHYGDGFIPEVPGNHILQLRLAKLRRMAEPRRAFWRGFEKVLWPAVIAAASEALSGPLSTVFGEDYYRRLSLAQPLTLMQADPTYPGHDMHTHFYHCPHWAFTMLLYIDPEDTYSRGTGIHQLLGSNGAGDGETSYRTDDLDWRIEVAMDTFHWLDKQKPDRRYNDRVIDYKSNRLFVFMDGPLALHSVPLDNPDRQPNPGRANNGGRRARRRIIRSHLMLDKGAFYPKHSRMLPEPIALSRYARIMAPNAILSDADRQYRDGVLRPFFRERLQAYGRAAESHSPRVVDRQRPFGEGYYTRDKFGFGAYLRAVFGWIV